MVMMVIIKDKKKETNQVYEVFQVVQIYHSQGAFLCVHVCNPYTSVFPNILGISPGLSANNVTMAYGSLIPLKAPATFCGDRLSSGIQRENKTQSERVKRMQG